jgi:hypothetical protein
MTLKTIVLAVAIGTIGLDPVLAQQVQLQIAVEVDCSAYNRNADGSWTALRANKILERGQAWREVAPGDNLEKLSRLLDGLCARTK